MEHFCDNYFPNYFRKKAPSYMFSRDLYRPNQKLDESNGIQKLNVIKTIHHLFLVNISLKFIKFRVNKNVKNMQFIKL